MIARSVAHNNAPENGQSTHPKAREIAASKMRNERSSDVLTCSPTLLWPEHDPDPKSGPSLVCFRGPVGELDASCKGCGTRAAGLVDESFAFLHVPGILAEGIGDVGLVGDQDRVGAGLGRRVDELPHGLARFCICTGRI